MACDLGQLRRQMPCHAMSEGWSGHESPSQNENSMMMMAKHTPVGEVGRGEPQWRAGERLPGGGAGAGAGGGAGGGGGAAAACYDSDRKSLRSGVALRCALS